MDEPNTESRGFGSIAAYYEILSDSQARLNREGPLLQEWLDRAPQKHVWDIACGTGLHAEFFAARAEEVLALDASPHMIEFALAKRPNDHIRYEVCDMRNLPQRTAGLIVCLGNSLSLLSSVGEARQVVVDVAQRLVPGGLFAIQVVNNAADGMNESRHRVELKDTSDGAIIAIKDLVPQGDRTLLSLTFFHEIAGRYTSVNDTAVLLHLSLEDISAAAEQAGLFITDINGGYDKRPFDEAASSDLIVVMQKQPE